MRNSLPFCGRRGIGAFIAFNFLFLCPPTIQTIHSIENTGPVDRVDSLIRQLYTREGKVKYLFSINPGGPVFDYSTSMQKLVEQGNAIQPRLLPELKDPRVRNEVALILSKTGDKDALPRLIEYLPTKETLSQEESFSTMCLLYALWQLTGMELGIHHKFSPEYTPKFRKEWQAWYESNKDYLYSPSKPKRTAYHWALDRVLVDVEAKFAARPTTAYRKEHPWIAYEDIKAWRDDPANAQKLKDFCVSVILNLSWKPHGYAPREAIRSLGRIRDSRALSSLHTLCALAEDLDACHDLIWTLEERGDVSSIPILGKIPRSKDVTKKSDSNERMRLRAIERIRLLEKYRKEIKGKPFSAEQQTDFMRCLEGSKGVATLIANLRNRDYDWALSYYLREASYVDHEQVRSCLKQMARDDSRDDRARTMVHGALARVGEKGSIDCLKQSLKHKDPGVRLAAAEGLWHS